MSRINPRITVKVTALFLLVLALSVSPLFASSLTQGSTTTARTFEDSSAGGVYIYAGNTFQSGENITNFSWFGPVFAGTKSITPLLFSVSGGTYTVVDIGAFEQVTDNSPAQVLNFGFGSQAGTTLTGSTWTFGFLEGVANSTGAITVTSAGGIQFNTPIDGGAGVGGGTNDWVFTPHSTNVTNVAIGATFGTNGTFALNNPGLGGFNVDRTYSAQATGSLSGVPEPGTFSLIAGSGLVLAGLFRYRFVRGRRNR